MLLGTSRRIQNNCIKVYLNDKLINFTTKYRYLRVLVDQNVNLKEHFDQAFRKASGMLRLLKKIRSSLTMDAAESIYKYMIMPPLTYSSVVTLNLNAAQTSRIENLQDRASRVINPSESADLRLPDLMNFAKLQKCVLVKQCMDRNVCSNYHNYFERVQHVKNIAPYLKFWCQMDTLHLL